MGKDRTRFILFIPNGPELNPRPRTCRGQLGPITPAQRKAQGRCPQPTVDRKGEPPEETGHLRGPRRETRPELPIWLGGGQGALGGLPQARQGCTGLGGINRVTARII